MLAMLLLGICTAVLFPTVHGADAGTKKPKIRHEPTRPRSGQSVSILVPRSLVTQGVEPTLQYQVVEPGNYIEKESGAYQQNWKSVMATNDAARPDALRFEIPGAVQVHRRLVRYRIAEGAKGSILAPKGDEAPPNFAYFVYDGIPSWKASVKPGGTKSEFSGELLGTVQAYHLIATRKAVEDSQWKAPINGGMDERHEYRWTGTLVGSDGAVYDHIRFRPRGGGWRHSMGKNMWKLDFNKGQGFRARDDWGEPYRSKWSKLNLGACIQQGDYGMRGEQGMFESVGFRLFNLAGLPAPETHFVHWRVITTADEQGKDQYGGDFWGLYLAVENVDDDFIENHGLPDQSVFKVDGMRPHWGKQGGDNLTEVDAGRFVQRLFSRPTAQWWSTNIDLSLYYNYRAILECIHHYDIDAGKNYYFRRDPVSKRWAVVPWDIDLTWGEHMYGMGREPFSPALTHPEIQQAYQNRLRAVRDLLFNTDQTGALIDEYAALIATPQNGLTFVEADRRKWDHHPIMSSPYVMGGKTEPGIYYTATPAGTFAGMVRLMKGYVATRAKWVDNALLSRATIPPTPKLAPPPSYALSKRPLPFSVTTPSSFKGRVEWHLGEVTPKDTISLQPKTPRRYEINTLWATNGPSAVDLPGKVLQPGRTYRMRARILDETGVAGHYSAPVEFVAEP